MLTRLNYTHKVSTIAVLVLVVALSTAWALTTYSGSQLIRSGNGGQFYLVNEGQDKIRVKIPNSSLDDYMVEQGVNEVLITADLTEDWVDDGSGGGHYSLVFTFGPSGAYFAPDDLELKIEGKYTAGETQVCLYDENGEEIEYEQIGNSNQITFYIEHFSCYYYEDYCD